MNKRSKSAASVAVGALFLAISLNSAVLACQVDDFLLTREGNLAAPTPEALNDALATGQDNHAKLADLLQKGTILKLKEGVKVEVLERSVEWKMLKIKIPNGNVNYWVKDGALKQIDCK